MIVTYSPEDGDAQRWEWNPRKVRSLEAERVEKRYGEDWSAFVRAVHGGQMRARRILLWHLLRREHPALRFEDVPDFFADELRVELSRAELIDARERAEAQTDIDPEVKAQVIEALDAEIKTAPSLDDEGKASASSVAAI